MPFSQRKKCGLNLPPCPPQREHPVDPGKRRNPRCSERGTRHSPAARLVAYDSSKCNSQLVPQKAQEQENQLRNQLKQNYMQIVSSNYCVISLLPTETFVLVWLPEATAGTGSGEENFCYQTTGCHRHSRRSREKRESTHSLYE